MDSGALSKNLKVTISPPKECDTCGMFDLRCKGVCASMPPSETVVSAIASMIAKSFQTATLAGVVPYTSVQTIVDKVRGLFKR